MMMEKVCKNSGGIIMPSWNRVYVTCKKKYHDIVWLKEQENEQENLDF